jgi:alpha-1,3-rhamnosyl/mannosyltransferase
MKIVIDATSMLLRSAGVKNYLYYWIRALQQASAATNDRIAIHPFELPLPTVLDHEHSPASPMATWVRLGTVAFLNLPGNPGLDWLMRDADLLHVSRHVFQRPKRVKTTSTIYDLSCWTTPDYHTPANVKATIRHAEFVWRRADGLIAISEHAKQDAYTILGIPREQVRVIYPGIAEAFFHVSPQEVAGIKQRLGLDRPYLLFVGCVEPRKNVPGIVRAYLALPERLRHHFQLVFAGPFGWADQNVRRMLLNSGENVRYLGYVAEDDLPGLIGGATAMVYPSFYEGFGLPLAQAMAAGIPVIGSNRSSLPEVIGDSGIVVNPDATEEITAAMERVCEDTAFASELSRKGRSRAELFRLARCASESLRFFHDVAGKR